MSASATTVPSVSSKDAALGPSPSQRRPTGARLLAWIPSWTMITTKRLEVRRRRGLMIAVVVLSLALPILVLGLRLLFHAVDPKSYGPAGSPGVFESLTDPMAEFGFIIAAAVGATLGASDLGEGVFRQLVITGRSRVALFLARIPAGLSILLPLIALGFTMNCLVTSYAGSPQPTSIQVNGYSIAARLSENQLKTWVVDHPREAAESFGVVTIANRSVQYNAGHNISRDYAEYTSSETVQSNPAINEMVKIGLWLELEVGVGFIFGLGLGSLTGQRTVSVIVILALQLIVTPILAAHVIPYFINGQRLVVGIPLTQLRPAGLAPPAGSVGGGPRRLIFGGRGALGIPAMPTWAMVSVIVGWIAGWTGIGAWKMQTRDA